MPSAAETTDERPVRAASFLLLTAATLVVWYGIAANYDYAALSGTYTLSRNGKNCILYLRPDQTFSEELSRSGVEQKAQGRWRRHGEAHVSFSSEFRKLSGQELNAAGETHGQFNKTFGLFSSLTLAPLPDGPTLRKNCFADLATQAARALLTSMKEPREALRRGLI